jgi:hypothetical protein
VKGGKGDVDLYVRLNNSTRLLTTAEAVDSYEAIGNRLHRALPGVRTLTWTGGRFPPSRARQMVLGPAGTH